MNYCLPVKIPESVAKRIECELAPRRGYASIEAVLSDAVRRYLERRVQVDFSQLEAEIANHRSAGYLGWREVDLRMDSNTFIRLRNRCQYRSLLEGAILRRSLHFWEQA